MAAWLPAAGSWAGVTTTGGRGEGQCRGLCLRQMEAATGNPWQANVGLELGGQEEGLALFDLQATPDGTLFQDVLVRLSLSRPGGQVPQQLPYHTFSRGDVVLLSSPAAGASASCFHPSLVHAS